MSSTGRLSARRSADYYPTPAWCVDRLLEAPGLFEVLTGYRWLEPCAGEGHIMRAVSAERERYGPLDWSAVEMRPECAAGLRSFTGRADAVLTADVLSAEADRWMLAQRPHTIITNPPFIISDEVTRRLLRVAEASNASLAILHRLNFLGTDSRSWLNEAAPDVYILPNRPAFVDGRTDSCEYAWFVWPRGQYARRRGYVQRLASTPIEERRGSPASAIPSPEGRPHLSGTQADLLGAI